MKHDDASATASSQDHHDDDDDDDDGGRTRLAAEQEEGDPSLSSSSLSSLPPISNAATSTAKTPPDDKTTNDNENSKELEKETTKNDQASTTSQSAESVMPSAPNETDDASSTTATDKKMATTPSQDSSSSSSTTAACSATTTASTAANSTTTTTTTTTSHGFTVDATPTTSATGATSGSTSTVAVASARPTTTTTTTTAPVAPIRLHLKPAAAAAAAGRKKSRKRKATGNPLAVGGGAVSGYNSSSSSGGSSGGSSDEEEVVVEGRGGGGGGGGTGAAYHGSPQHASHLLHHHHHAAATAAPSSHAPLAKVARTMDPMNVSQHHSRSLSNENNGSSSGSSNTDEHASSPEPASADHNSSNSASNPHNNARASLEQPKGWRVKLYRLNADGSWDDCGTGRIQCLYKGSSSSASASAHNNNNDSNRHSDSPPSSPSSSHQSPTDQWLYQKTGEPTLVVQAELTKQNRQPRVLLRTRILLRDAYQRQGDNIITWCEPCFTPPLQQQQQDQNQQQQQQSSTKQGRGGGNNNNNNDNGGNPEGGVDLALSFQDNAGCLDIWRQITLVQSQAAEYAAPASQVQRLAAAVAAQHHADLVQQDQQQQVTSSGPSGPNSPNPQQQGGVPQHGHHEGHGPPGGVGPHHHHHHHAVGGIGANNAFRSLQQSSPQSSTEQLWAHMTEDEHHRSFGAGDGYHMLEAVAPPTMPDPPSLQNLEEVADSIAALQHVQQRESLAMWIAKDECRYLKVLLTLFEPAERDADYEKLATLAACVKTILLLNDPSIVELIVTIAELFEKVCACLEYDPDLREKANHRWFLRERAKFRTVVTMDDPELVAAIHRSFRVNYLRDTLLRPTMDESSLSALTSMQTFSHGDIVKGVTLSPEKDASLADSYLMRLIRVFGNELHALSVLEWMELDAHHADSQIIPDYDDRENDARPDPSIVVMGKSSSAIMDGTTWKQYLAPQDASVRSRRIRRRGCLSFLRELFSMVRNSLQQSDKDDFFAVICGFEVELGEDFSDNVSQHSQTVEVGSVASTVKSDRLGTDASSQADFPTPSSPVTVLSLLGNVLCDPNTDATEKGSVLEIIGTVAMHDPALIRRHCLDHYNEKKRTTSEREAFVGRPDPNENRQVVFQCPHNDLLAALIFLLDAETDAGVLLQVSEIMRLLLDTDMMGDQGPPNSGFADEAEGIAPHAAHGADHPNPASASGSVGSNGANATTDQKQFLSMFYESYVEWLVAPLQFQIFQCVRRVPAHVLRSPQEFTLMEKMLTTFRKGIPAHDQFLRPVPACAMRSSFAVELLSFCVRAHLYRMKFFLLKSRVLGSVLDLLHRPADRCLKLAALRFLRAILSVNDEFYHRHIIQHDLFAPVFAAFRANPVGDNLVSSAIVEMCDFIHTENIRSLLEYVVTKHLSATPSQEAIPSLEDVSSPYVSTLTVLRKTYEAHLQKQEQQEHLHPHPQHQQHFAPGHPDGSPYFPGNNHHHHHHHTQALTGEALEDQRKFQQADAEASYFESGGSGNSSDDLLHRTPRMFSFPTTSQMDPSVGDGTDQDESDMDATTTAPGASQ